MDTIRLKQISKQMNLLERSVRAIRVSIDASLFSSDFSYQEKEFEIRNSLSNIINKKNNIERKSAESYVEFAPGLSLGYPSKSNTHCDIEVKSLSSEENLLENNGHSCLIVHPSFDKNDLVEWMTLEIDLDLSDIKIAKQLYFKIIPLFIVEDDMHIPNFAMQLRFYYDRGFVDCNYERYPALSYPIELTCKIDKEKLDPIDFANVKKSKILIHLPLEQRYKYKFFISYFEVLANKAS